MQLKKWLIFVGCWVSILISGCAVMTAPPRSEPERLWDTKNMWDERRKVAEKQRHLARMNDSIVTYIESGNFDKALPLAEQALKEHRELWGKEHPNTLVSMTNLAVIYQQLGRLDYALRLFSQVLEIRQTHLGKENTKTLTSMNNLATVYQLMNQWDDALSLYQEVWELRNKYLGDKNPSTLASLHNLANLYLAMGNFNKALPLFEQSLALHKEVLGNRHAYTFNTMNDLVKLYLHLNPQLDTAFILAKKSVDGCTTLGEEHLYTLESLANLATLYTKKGQIDKAIDVFQQFVNSVEALRQKGDLSAENRQSLFKQWITGYFQLSQLYLLRHQTGNAFRVSEMTKARTLLESMTITLAAQKAGLNQDELQQLQQNQARIIAFNERIAKEEDLDNRLALEMEKNQLVREAATFHRRLMQQYPRYAELNQVQIVDAKAGASLIPEEALFISYLLHDNQVLVFTLDTKGNLQAKDLGEIPNLVQTLTTYNELLGKQCTVKELVGCEGKSVLRLDDGSFVIKNQIRHQEKRQRINSLDEISRYLGNKLLEPLKDLIAGKKHLLISPDGALALIPFDALLLDNQPVIANHHVSYVQSLSVLALLKKREKLYQSLENRGTLLAMGAARYEQPGQTIERNKCNQAQRMPSYNLETMLSRNVGDPKRYQRAFNTLDITWCNLPGTEQELNDIEKIFAETQPMIFRDAQATEATLQSLNQQGTLRDYRYLLFSAHGYLNVDAPALSAVVLDQLSKTTDTDGYVTASEWPSYDLKSDLMVLSACQTGVGKVVQGEGIMGLPYALYVAGNKNTLLTLWSVLDDSTATFTARFFKRLQGGKGQLEALTATKREFLDSEKHKRPLYWAPFVLYGI